MTNVVNVTEIRKHGAKALTDGVSTTEDTSSVVSAGDDVSVNDVDGAGDAIAVDYDADGNKESEEFDTLPYSSISYRQVRLTGHQLVNYRKRTLSVTQGNRKQLSRTVDVLVWFATQLFELRMAGEWRHPTIDELMALDGEDLSCLLVIAETYGQAGNSPETRI